MSYLECILRAELTGLPYGLDISREMGVGGRRRHSIQG